MQVAQADFCTVLIRRDSLSFFLRYSLYQDGEERFPESISCREETVVAYFLTSTIRDYLRETPQGFAVERSWTIVPEGQFALSFCLDLPESPSLSLLLPAEAAAAEVTPEGLKGSGRNTAYPSGLYLLGGPRCVLAFADPPGSPAEPGGVSGRRVVIDEEPLVRIEIRVPAEAAAPAGRTPRPPARGRAVALPGFLVLRGNHEQALRFNVVSEGASKIFQRGLGAALERFDGKLHRREPLDREAVRGLAEQAIRGCLDSHLVHRGGVHGLCILPRGAELSSPAGIGLANLLVECLPRDSGMIETALRLADFALKGQHPGGLFYDIFSTTGHSWLGPPKRGNDPPLIRLSQAAEVATGLLRISETLQAHGRPADRYRLAAERMGQALLAGPEDLTAIGDTLLPDSLLAVGAGSGAHALVELFLRLGRLTGRDPYKKAVAALASRLFSEPPEGYAAALGDPASLCLEGALLQARSAALLAESGHRGKGLEEYLSRLLPWVCVNQRPLPHGLSMIGGLASRLGEHRLVFRGFEFAYTALSLDRQLGDSPKPRIPDGLVPQLLGFTLQRPLGTAWVAAAEEPGPAEGPVDARILVRELEALLRLQEQFPEALGSSPGGR